VFEFVELSGFLNFFWLHAELDVATEVFPAADRKKLGGENKIPPSTRSLVESNLISEKAKRQEMPTRATSPRREMNSLSSAPSQGWLSVFDFNCTIISPQSTSLNHFRRNLIVLTRREAEMAINHAVYHPTQGSSSSSSLNKRPEERVPIDRSQTHNREKREKKLPKQLQSNWYIDEKYFNELALSSPSLDWSNRVQTWVRTHTQHIIIGSIEIEGEQSEMKRNNKSTTLGSSSSRPPPPPRGSETLVPMKRIFAFLLLRRSSSRTCFLSPFPLRLLRLHRFFSFLSFFFSGSKNSKAILIVVELEKVKKI
jgi:hypothetical protein